MGRKNIITNDFISDLRGLVDTLYSHISIDASHELTEEEIYKNLAYYLCGRVKSKKLDKLVENEMQIEKEEVASAKIMVISLMCADCYEYYNYLKSLGNKLNTKQEEIYRFLDNSKNNIMTILKKFAADPDFAYNVMLDFAYYKGSNIVLIREAMQEIKNSGKLNRILSIAPYVLIEYYNNIFFFEKNFKTELFKMIFTTYLQGQSDIKEQLREEYREDSIDAAVYKSLNDTTEEMEEEIIYEDEDGEIVHEPIDNDSEYQDEDFQCDDFEDDDEDFEGLEERVDELTEELYSTIYGDIMLLANKKSILESNRVISLLIKEAYKYLKYYLSEEKLENSSIDLRKFIARAESVDELIEAFKNDEDFGIKIIRYYIISKQEDYYMDESYEQLVNSKDFVKINKYISKGHVNK